MCERVITADYTPTDGACSGAQTLVIGGECSTEQGQSRIIGH